MTRAMDAKNRQVIANATCCSSTSCANIRPSPSTLTGSQHADKVMLTTGRESRGYPAYEVNVELGRKLGLNLIELPGGHVGYVAQPAEFAHELMQALARAEHPPRGVLR